MHISRYVIFNDLIIVVARFMIAIIWCQTKTCTTLHGVPRGRLINTWPIYFVNDFQFYTKKWSNGRKTINCGVCIKGSDHGNEENYYYRIIK